MENLSPSSTGLKYFDTFAGIGGFSVALTELGHECIGFSEIDRHASQVYSSHFPSHTPYGDITSIDPAQLPDFDLLVGGFPCQAFSVAGHKRGFEDARGTLFFELCRIASIKRPRLLLFENVKGLLSHDGGRTFHVILSALDELGYDCQWQILNAAHFGVPQTRERVYLVGHLRGTDRPEVFPLPCSARASVGEDRCVAYQNRRNITTVSDCFGTLTCTYRGKPDGDGRPGLLVDGRVRGLLPIECERLQGFEDGWTEGIPTSQRYRCIGNAVCVPVVREIVRLL